MSLLAGCNQTPDNYNTLTERRLLISAATDIDAGFTTIKAEDLGGNFEEDIAYSYLSDVNITIGKSVYPLEAAIRDGLITVEEIFAYARIDARNDICRETYFTYHGLTKFIYHYPEFDIQITYDVFDAPNGKQYLINDLLICQSGSSPGFGYKDDEAGESIAREDWGIEFEVKEANATSLTLRMRQYGGQQIGQLCLDRYGLYHTENKQERIKKLDGTKESVSIAQAIPLQMNGTSEITLNWEMDYGVLSSGNYTMYLYIQDIFDAEDVHPLMEDFSDNQIYWIDFAIP